MSASHPHNQATSIVAVWRVILILVASIALLVWQWHQAHSSSHRSQGHGMSTGTFQSMPTQP
jgi:hypothetical protein